MLFPDPQKHSLPDGTVAAMLSPATELRRKRGPSLSRRTGQKGNVFQKGSKAVWSPTAPAYGRFWVDVPGRDRHRKKIALGICHTKTVAKQKLREHIEREGVNSNANFTINTAPATTFRAQAAQWIGSLSMRRRRPVKPATIFGWQHALNKWVLPNLGGLLLADVGNAALKELIQKMNDAGLSAQSIVK